MKIQREALKEYFPFGNLSDDYLDKVVDEIEVRDFPQGTLIFKRGDISEKSFYLMKGKVDICDDQFNVKSISTESSERTHTLDNYSPHRVSVIAKLDTRVFTLSRELLNLVMVWSHSGDIDDRSLTDSKVEVEELAGAEESVVDDGDWMVNLLQSPLFAQVPPGNIQLLFSKFELISARAGEVVIKMGEDGDYFYVIQSGTAKVYTNISDPGKGQIASLKTGDFFGGDALIGDTTRNATIKMDTNGYLMRLSKTDFKTLLQEPILETLSPDSVKEVIAAVGDRVEFVDVRLPVEYRCAHVPNSINIPLDKLRVKKSQFDDEKVYFITSEGGRRSEIAAHIIMQAGCQSYILKDSESYY